MPTTHLILGVSMVINVAIGLSVYLANPRRAQNFQFFLFSSNMSLWGFIVLGIITTRDPDTAAILIRVSSFVSALIPLSFHLLCLAIKNPDHRMFDLLKGARFTLFFSQVAGLLCLAPDFLLDLRIPEATNNPMPFPEAEYGPVYLLYALYYPVVMAFILVSFIRSMRQAGGVQYEEFRFILLGMGSTVVLGMTTNAIIPAISGNSQSQPFGPISIVAMNAIIAYGLATRRIMDVAYVLQRAAAYALLTVYLVLLYGFVWGASHILLLRLAPDAVPLAHLFGALALAFSVAPAHGSMQQFANRLFVTRHAMDVGSAVGQVNTLLKAISTIPSLLEQFSETISKSMGTNSIAILLQGQRAFVQRYPETSNRQLKRAEYDDPLITELQVTRHPIVADELERLRPSPELHALLDRMNDLEAKVAIGVRSMHRLEGVLLLGPKVTERIYAASELKALQILCDQLAVALENAELYTQTQDSKIYNETLLDNLTSGVIAVSADGRITVINREAQRVTGLNPDDVIDQPYEVLPPPLTEAMRQTIESGEILRDYDQVLLRGDEEVAIRLGSSFFGRHTGETLGTLLVFNDLSTIKRLESEVRRTDRLASLGTLAAGMAHEIKNPLVSIKTFTQLLPERYQDTEFRESFSSLVGHEIKRIDLIVNQLLSFARPAKPVLAPTHLHEVLDRCLRLVGQQLHQKGVKLESALRASDDMMRADANQLQQAVINFLLNAIDSMGKGGVLTVTTELVRYDWKTLKPARRGRRGERQILLTFRDTGEGIRPEDVARIFDPFYTTKSQGTGLGLAVSHGIIQEHGGVIDVASVPEQGTAFHILFPTVQEEAVV